MANEHTITQIAGKLQFELFCGFRSAFVNGQLSSVKLTV
jgi:hypothetical protein